ncbi:hypothetical protein FSP39_005422 [Pinctada imbricata]|uniref:DNA endonuclease activator Ctp1 C-terminal domain-containing protein n=1 Tax=Pinctada imbricata TaxID=66713 RepID=A0AA88XL24_PINIB|nr:hypothetical protein FSP39_005422 [Pinctada imbricata]
MDNRQSATFVTSLDKHNIDILCRINRYSLKALQSKVDSWKENFELLQKQKHRGEKSCSMCTRLQKMMDDLSDTYKESLQMKEKYIRNLESQLANVSLNASGNNRELRTPLKDINRVRNISAFENIQSPDSTSSVVTNQNESRLSDTSPGEKSETSQKGAKLKLGGKSNKRSRYVEDPSPENKRMKLTDDSKTRGKTKKSAESPHKNPNIELNIMVPETCDPDLLFDNDVTCIENQTFNENVIANIPETVAIDTGSSHSESDDESQCTVRENTQVKSYSLRSILCSPRSSASDDENVTKDCRSNTGGQMPQKPGMKKSQSLPLKLSDQKGKDECGKPGSYSFDDAEGASPNILAGRTHRRESVEIQSPLLLQMNMGNDGFGNKVNNENIGEINKQNEDIEPIDLISSGESVSDNGSPKLQRKLRSSQSRISSPRARSKVKPITPTSFKPKRIFGTSGNDKVECAVSTPPSNRMKQTTLSQVLGQSPIENNLDNIMAASKEEEEVRRAIELSLREAEMETPVCVVEVKENSPPVFKRPVTPRKSKTLANKKLKSPNKAPRPAKSNSKNSTVSFKKSHPSSTRYETSLNRSVDPAIQLSELCQDSEDHDCNMDDISIASIGEFHADDLRPTSAALDPRTSTCVDLDNDSHSLPSSYKFGGSRRQRRKEKKPDMNYEDDLMATLTGVTENDPDQTDMDCSFDRRPRKEEPGFAHVNVVRKQDERRKLKAHDCKECYDYYSGMDLSPGELKRRIQTCSRHRADYCPPSTPDHFWDVGIEDTFECEERGYIGKEETTKDQPRFRRRRQLRKFFKSRTEEEESEKNTDKNEEESVSDIEI